MKQMKRLLAIVLTVVRTAIMGKSIPVPPRSTRAARAGWVMPDRILALAIKIPTCDAGKPFSSKKVVAKVRMPADAAQ